MSNVYSAILQCFFYLFIIIVVIIGLHLFWNNWNYKKSNYYKESGNSFLKTFYSKGNWGEYELFKTLEKLKGNQKIMTNLYIPQKNGSTTEVDLLMIHETGIYVFEYKNYSGWIFGSEKDKMWMQTLQSGDKNKFYNPILQNKGHISAIDSFLNKKYTEKLYSHIVFSDRCELKKITLTSNDAIVNKKNELNKVLKKEFKRLPVYFTSEQIQEVYQTLKPQTKVDNVIKQEHIECIKKKYG